MPGHCSCGRRCCFPRSGFGGKWGGCPDARAAGSLAGRALPPAPGSHPPPRGGCDRVTGVLSSDVYWEGPEAGGGQGGAVRVVGGELHLISLSDLLAGM